MTTDIKHLLKVYNYVNDESRPKVNLKFLGLFAGFLVAGGGLIALALLQLPSGPSGTEGGGGDEGTAAAQSKTDYVGLSPLEMDAQRIDADLVQSRLDSWHAAHPRATIEQMEPVYEAGRLVGYEITYKD